MTQKFKLIGIYLLEIEDLDKIIEEIRKLETRGLYIQPFPCKYVLKEKLIEIAADLAVNDFEIKVNKAKKISTEFLLRITGKSQIHEAIRDFFQTPREDNPYYIVIFTDGKDVTKKEIEEILAKFGKRKEHCIKDLNAIKEKYKIFEEEIKAVKRPREDIKDAILKLLLERISLSIYS